MLRRKTDSDLRKTLDVLKSALHFYWSSIQGEEEEHNPPPKWVKQAERLIKRLEKGN